MNKKAETPKRPIEQNHEGKNLWVWYRWYPNHPVGLRPHLLPGRIFEKMCKREKLPSHDPSGNPMYAIGFDSELEAIDAASIAKG